MSTVGSITMKSTLNPPIMLTLSSAQANVSSSSNNNCVFNVGSAIKATDQNYVCEISLDYMSFYNTIPNITSSNNILKILSLYTVNGVQSYNIITVTIPVGHYNVTTLMNYLNTAGICNNTTGGFYYGFGNGTNMTYPPFYLNPNDSSKLNIQLPNAGTGAGNTLGVYNAAHVYNGFFLLVDSTTIPFLNTIGYVYKTNNDYNNDLTINWASQTFSIIGAYVYNGGTGTDYSYIQPYVDPASLELANLTPINVLDMGGPTSITIAIQEISTDTLVSYNHLNKGNIIATVPISASYGSKNVYTPTNPAITYIQNLDLNSITVIIRSIDTGLPVSFQGTNWTIALKLVYYEIENAVKSEAAQGGVYKTTMPIFHNDRPQHIPLLTERDNKKHKRRHLDNVWDNNND